MREGPQSDTLERSWLIQRLTKPINPDKAPNPFSFGGGYKNGGLTDEARKAIHVVFDFDYMGAAEFEWGILPKTLSHIAENIAKYEAVIVPLNRDKDIYLICKASQRFDIQARIREWSMEDFNDLKESTHLKRVLAGEKYTDRYGGWLELDNGFFFFTDKRMWEGTCALFGLDVPKAAWVKEKS